MGAWLPALVALTSLTLAPDGKPSVAVLSADRASLSTAFVESMRIQLTSMASVDAGPALSGRTQREKADQAHLYLMKTGATIAVWEERRIDPLTGRAEIVVHAVTRESPSDAVEVARVATSGAPEDDRVLALKVGELLFQVLSVAKSEEELAAALESRRLATPPAKVPPPPPPPPPAPKRRPARLEPARTRAFAEAGGGLRVDSRFASPRVGGKLLVGVGLQRQAWRLELAAGARRLTDLQLRADNGWLTLRETNVGAGLRGLWSANALSLGLGVTFSADYLAAAATSLDGRQGAAQKLGFCWGIGPEGRLRIAPQLEMRALIALETALYEQRFAIEATPVERHDASRGTAELSLSFSVP